MVNCQHITRNDHIQLNLLLENKMSRDIALSDIHFLYIIGVSHICMGKTVEGLSYLTRAEELKSPFASALISAYFLTDKTFKNSVITDNFKSYKVAVHYLQKSFNYFIHQSQNKTMDNVESVFVLPPEERMFISARVFATLPNLYFMQYGKTVLGIFDTDTLQDLQNLKQATTDCKLWGSVAKSYGDRADNVYQALLKKCQYYNDFSKEVLQMEKERLSIVKQCNHKLSSCPKHKKMVEKILQLAIGYRNKLAEVRLQPMY